MSAVPPQVFKESHVAIAVGEGALGHVASIGKVVQVDIGVDRLYQPGMGFDKQDTGMSVLAREKAHETAEEGREGKRARADATVQHVPASEMDIMADC